MGDFPDLRATLRRACWRICLLAFGWWAVLDDGAAGLSFGIPVVLVATIASLMLCPPAAASTHLRPVQAVRLGGAFLVGSLRGGWDIAMRALSPRLPLSPNVVIYSTRLAPGPAQRLFTSLITLMPGTLSVYAHGYRVGVHVLVDRGEAQRRELAALEARVADAVWTHTPEDGASHA